jgi:hypothetical protein
MFRSSLFPALVLFLSGVLRTGSKATQDGAAVSGPQRSNKLDRNL